jgi:hypothetical protein
MTLPPALIPYLSRYGLMAAALVAIWLHGCSVGQAGAERKAQAQEAARMAADARERARQMQAADRLSTQHHQALERARALEQQTEALRDALRNPPICPAGQSLADLPIPAAAVRSLRDAAGGDGPP